MKQFVFGAVFGAALTALGFALFGAPASAPLRPYRTMDRPPPMAVPQAVPLPATLPAPSAQPSSEPALRASGGASLPPPPMPPQAPPAGPGPGAEPPPPAPRLSSEHAELLKPRPRDGQPLTLPELHLQLSSERPDPNWSLAMEQALRDFIAQSNGSGEFEVLNVECRTTLCEITLFGNLPGSGTRWNSLLADMGQQSWGPQFQGQSTSFSGVNGRITIVSILQRAKR